MTNRERLNSLTDEEIAKALCYLVQDVNERMDYDYPCAYCPVHDICSQGNNGFKVWLKREASEDVTKI